MEDAIREIYGQDTDARTYLQKLFHLRISLPQIDVLNIQYRLNDFINRTWNSLDLFNIPNSDANLIEFSGFCWRRKLSLRTIQKILSNYALSYLSRDFSNLCWPELTALMCISREIDPVLYDKISNKEATYDLIKNLYNMPEHTPNYQHHSRIWMYITKDENLSGDDLLEVQKYFGGRSQESIMNIPREISGYFSEYRI